MMALFQIVTLGLPFPVNILNLFPPVSLRHPSFLNKMINLYSAIKQNDVFRKLEVNELLFVEYTCMREETKLGIWSDNNYFAFISSGKKAWRTIYHTYEVNKGDILFIKKGANLTHQFFDDEFCAIFVFIPDDFIKGFLNKNSDLIDQKEKDISSQDAVIRLQSDELLENYYHSIESFLFLSEQPNKQLVQLKFEELLLSLFSSNVHEELTNYFVSLCQNQLYHMSRVMEQNFAYNLKLEEFARLCHMSLSTFKKSFKEFFHTTPAAWLKERKLDRALHQLLTSELPISQISFESGFEDTSHFIRVFKQKHGFTPLQYRQKFSRLAKSSV
jgi:AraC family transcriptional regulator, exoenzyme S synthesis regulatory protein ExsA